MKPSLAFDGQGGEKKGDGDKASAAHQEAEAERSILKSFQREELKDEAFLHADADLRFRKPSNRSGRKRQTEVACVYDTLANTLTLVRGVWEKREKPSNRYSWSSYSITVGLSVWNTNSEVSRRHNLCCHGHDIVSHRRSRLLSLPVSNMLAML